MFFVSALGTMLCSAPVYRLTEMEVVMFTPEVSWSSSSSIMLDKNRLESGHNDKILKYDAKQIYF